jgi:inward rectifier potassium channel
VHKKNTCRKGITRRGIVHYYYVEILIAPCAIFAASFTAMSMSKLKQISDAVKRERELGFGMQIVSETRMMNPDGSFNVRRHRESIFDNLYYHLITMNTGLFFGLLVVIFFLINAFFAEVYLLIGVDQLSGFDHGTWWQDYQKAFFFSSQTLTTVGYGHISPQGLAANIAASIESFLGLLTFALISGLLYGRFSRPTAKVSFSEQLLMAPYHDRGYGLMFRMVNPRRSELIETEVQVILTLYQEDTSGKRVRRFFPLDLEINKVTFFTLTWTLVHHLNEKSPLYGFSHDDMTEAHAEVLVLVKGVDESTEQLVHARKSYTADEIVWNAKFLPIMETDKKSSKAVIRSKRVGLHQKL